MSVSGSIVVWDKGYHVPFAFQYIYMDAVMKEVKMEIGRTGVRFTEEGRWERMEIA